MRRYVGLGVMGVCLALWCLGCGVGARAAEGTPVTQPPHLAHPPSSGPGGLFNGVSCWAVDACIAVGGSSRGDLADRLTARGWTAMHPVAPGGGDHVPTLYSVSCVDANFCVAAGNNGCTGASAQLWNGHTWRLIDAGLATGCQSGELGPVSCATTRLCVAVGIRGLVTWNGRAWSAEVTPGGSHSTFDSVSCTSATFCAAGGLYFSATGDGQANEVATWNGHSWRLRVYPYDSTSGPTGITGVSCVSSRFCLALGTDQDLLGGSGSQATWNGTRWSNESYPPILTHANADDENFNTGPDGVSCASTVACTSYYASANQDGEPDTAVQVHSATGWTVGRTAFGGTESVNAAPKAISCPTAGWCLIVGYLSAAPVSGHPAGPTAATTS